MPTAGFQSDFCLRGFLFCSFHQCHCCLALWHVALRVICLFWDILNSAAGQGQSVCLSIACSCLCCFSCWNPQLCVTHEAVMQGCLHESVGVCRWAGCCSWAEKVGLLIFRPDAQLLPGGLSPHLSRWQNTLQSVTPSHTLQGIRCVSVCQSCMSVHFSFPQKYPYTLYTPLYIVEATSPEVPYLRFWWVPDLQAKADIPTDC